MTDVTCLQIPKYWILQRNMGNVWTKIEHFLNTNIPSSEEVFQAFVNHREWDCYKKELVKKKLKRGKINNLNNVPYAIRINHPEILCYK